MYTFSNRYRQLHIRSRGLFWWKQKKILDYKDSLFFKYYCGKVGDESLDFRRFLIKYNIHFNTDHISVGNGEPVALMSTDKKIIMDIFIIYDDYFLDLEM